METISIWSVVVASVAAFAIGALWYSPVLFGKEWMSLNKISEADIEQVKGGKMGGSYAIQFLMTIVTFVVMAFAISALGTNGRDGAMIGLIAWVGFILPISVSSMLWTKRPFKLVLIDSIHMLVTLVIGGAIIGVW